jgi:hypothetical protein
MNRPHLKDVKVFDLETDRTEYLVRLFGDEQGGSGVIWVDFEVIEVPMYEQGKPVFYRKEWISLADNTQDPNEADAVVSGYVKWDGCTEFKLDVHVCSGKGMDELFFAIKRARYEAAMLMGPSGQEDIGAEYHDAEGGLRPLARGLL